MTRAGARKTRSPLIDALAHHDASVVESAKETLAARGADAVPLLLPCLDGDDERLRLRAISLLAITGSAQAARAVTPLLHDAAPEIRQQAARALARLAPPGAVPALARLLEREELTVVRLAAVRSLLRLIQTGHDEAARPLLEVLSDVDEHPRVRVAALDAIPWLDAPRDGAQALVARLARDSQPDVAKRAQRLMEAPHRVRIEPWAIQRLLDDLGSERLVHWRGAVSSLGRLGGIVLEPLLEALLARPTDREYARRAGLVLQSLSHRQLARIGPYLDRINDPVPLLVLIDIAGSTGSRALLARVAALSQRLATASPGPGSGALDAVRQRAHLMLARAGSRLAIEDLRRLLEDRRVPVRTDLAEAVGLVGTRRELAAIVRAYRRCRGVARLAMRDALRSIAQREKIRRTDRALAALDAPERIAALEIMGVPQHNGRAGALVRNRIDRRTGPLLP